MSGQQRQESAATQGEAEAFGPRLLRRYLLGLLTALIVARPLVLGEDPGMLSPLTDASNLVLSLLWLVAVFGWAVWRWWSGEGHWYAGAVEAALLTAVVAVGIGAASVASYKHPAHLVAWEWLVLFAALFLMRQLADTEADRRGLLAAFLASVVSLSAYALYQYGVELPRERADLAKREKRSTGPAETPSLLAAGGPAGVLLREQYRAEVQETLAAYEARAARRQEAHSSAFATYVRPESFAGLLVLFLPALAAAALVRWRRQGNGWLTGLTAGCVLLAIAALWASHTRAALLALAAVGLVALLACGRQALKHKGLALLALAGLAGVALLGWVVPSSAGGQDRRDLLDCWASTWDMIRAHVWLGAGAGNFDRLYPQFMSPAAAGSVSDAHDFVLGLWATYGLFVLAAVLLALGLFFYLALRPLSVVRCPSQETTDNGQRTTDNGQRTRWEFYIGGMFGLLLGYYLRQAFQSPDEALLSPGLPPQEEVLRRGLVAGGRSVIWFAAFALFEGVPWSSKTLARALAAGVAALLLLLAVAGGIDFPSVAQPLWLVVGLALTARRVGLHPGDAGRWLSRALPLPLLAGLLSAFIPTVFYPVLRSASLARSALQAGAVFLEQRARHFPQMRNPSLFLKERVIKPLVEAAREDSLDAHRRTQAAFWYGTLWETLLIDAKLKGVFDPRAPLAQGVKLEDELRRFATQAVAALRDAEKWDPLGKEAYLIEVELHRSFARQGAGAEERKKHYALTAKALQKLAEIDPTSARVHYDLAVMLFAAGDPWEASSNNLNAFVTILLQQQPLAATACSSYFLTIPSRGRAAAREARRLDQLTPPQRQLTLVQRRQLKEWLDKRD